ncbi:MAG: hypothetical protein ACTHM2_06465 [Afipia sp.]
MASVEEVKNQIAAELSKVTTRDPLAAVDEAEMRLNALRVGSDADATNLIDRALWQFSMRILNKLIAEKAIFV